MYVNMGAESGTQQPGPNDVIIAVSDDGGITFTHAQYANVIGEGLGGFNGNFNGGKAVDGPYIASNPTAPWGTWVAWSANGITQPNCGGGTYCGYLNWVQYDLNDQFHKGGTPIVVPSAGLPDPNVEHPIISVGTIFDCTNTPHEAVFVAWSTDFPDCAPTIVNGNLTNACTTQDVSWHWAGYDTVTGRWAGPFFLDDDQAWPACIANPITPTTLPPGNPLVQLNPSRNTGFPRLATFVNSAVFVYPKHSGLGSRIMSQEHQLVWSGSCQSGNWVDVPNPLGTFQAPDPRGGGGGGGPPPQTCNSQYHDEWGPAIAFIQDTMTNSPEVLVTWYDTRDDVNNTNVNMYGALTNSLTSNPFANPFNISNVSTWNHNNAVWVDYQAIGVDSIQSGYNGTQFLAAWGGDARAGGPTGLWTARVQP